MSKNNKFPELEGVIYAKPVKRVIPKKGENKGKEIQIPSIVLEFTYSGGQRSQLMSFNIARNVPLDDFGVGDHVIITYANESIPWKEEYITKARAIYIKHADVDYNDTRDLRPQKPAKVQDTVFTGASPNDDDNGNDPLPF